MRSRNFEPPLVEATAISFELEPPSVEELAARIERTLRTHPWIVLERAGALLGYAYAGVFRARAAYRYTAETAIYVAAQARGSGAGKRLYAALLELLRLQGFHLAVAGLTLPNEASVALHRSLGFERVGAFPEVGRKFDAWHAVEFWQRSLAAGAPLVDAPSVLRASEMERALAEL